MNDTPQLKNYIVTMFWLNEHQQTVFAEIELNASTEDLAKKRCWLAGLAYNWFEVDDEIEYEVTDTEMDF